MRYLSSLLFRHNDALTSTAHSAHTLTRIIDSRVAITTTIIRISQRVRYYYNYKSSKSRAIVSVGIAREHY